MKRAYEIDGPVYVRAGSGREKDVYPESAPFNKEGITVLRRYGNDALLLSNGFVLDRVLEAAEVLKAQGILVTVGDINILYGKNPEAIVRECMLYICCDHLLRCTISVIKALFCCTPYTS